MVRRPQTSVRVNEKNIWDWGHLWPIVNGSIMGITGQQSKYVCWKGLSLTGTLWIFELANEVHIILVQLKLAWAQPLPFIVNYRCVNNSCWQRPVVKTCLGLLRSPRPRRLELHWPQYLASLSMLSDGLFWTFPFVLCTFNNVSVKFLNIS